MGLLGVRLELKKKPDRNINRHYYSNEEIAEEVQRPVVKSFNLYFLSVINQRLLDLRTIDVETIQHSSTAL